MRRSGTFNNSGSIEKYYKITGQGFVCISASYMLSTTNDTGTAQSNIYLSSAQKVNGDMLAREYARLQSSDTLAITVNASVMYPCDSVLYIYVTGGCTKNGTNSWIHELTAVGCTIEEY